MEFNIENYIEKLDDGTTYLLNFKQNTSIEDMRKVVEQVNEYLKKHNRNICFVYTRQDFASIEKE